MKKKRDSVKRASLLLLAVMLVVAFMPAGMTAQAAAKFPKKFDLRSKGLVTPVKKQDPFSSCWAFGGIAAAESSVLKAKKTTYAKSKLDLSERHAAYFALHPIQKFEEKSQAGEGLRIIKTGLNDEFTLGGQSIYVTSLFASGVGPMLEKHFPYHGKKGLTELQYVKDNKDKLLAKFEKDCNEAIEEFRKSIPGGESMSYEEVQQAMQKIVPGTYPVTYKSAKEEALAMYEQELKESSDPYMNGFSEKDDWSLPLKMFGSPTRMLYTDVTLKDGNILPEFSIRKKGKWQKINPKGTKAVKSELKKGHAVAMSIAADQSLPGEDSKGQYLNEDTWAHYTHENADTNHVVCIVGWDDNYSKKNFLAKKRPPGNGAWIVKNSWGSELGSSIVTADNGDKVGLNKWGVKNKAGKHTGYFYVSYYDKAIEMPETMAFTTDFAKKKGFFCEQYDFMPAMYYYKATSKKKMKVANVFKAEATSKLYSVTTNTPVAGTKAKFEIYKLRKNAKTPVQGKKVRAFSKKFAYAGFHRVNLKKKLKLKKNQKYSIVVTHTYKSGKKTVYGYNVSIGPSKKAAQMAKANFYSKGVVNKGESYIYTAKKWKDWKVYKASKKIKKKLENAMGPGAQADNFAIKAYLVK